MTSADRSQWTLGYCTNIHPGVEVSEICDSLKNVSAEVARRRRGYRPKPPAHAPVGKSHALAGKDNAGKKGTAKSGPSGLGIGLWLSHAATVTLRRHGMPPLIEAIEKNGLLAYTINGFPYDNFHQDRVKHAVYQPTWWHDERLIYTRDLAKILVELLPAEVTTGTISTLPLGWPRQVDADASDDSVKSDPSTWRDVTDEELQHAGTNFRRLAEDLRMLEDRTGKRIIVAIEPEPGCLLQTSEQVVRWFEKELPDPTQRRYIGVCHDVCHAAVMMENQTDVLTRYADAGIVLAKVQVSSAIVADWQTIDAVDRDAAMDELRRLAEDRYLHQTGRRTRDGKFSLSEDLPELIAETDLSGDRKSPAHDQRWVIHFHVPIFLEKFGHLRTTRSEIDEVVRAVENLTNRKSKKLSFEFTGHWEVETYAWSVFPDELRTGELAISDDMTHDQAMARDIAHELDWFEELLKQHTN